MASFQVPPASSVADVDDDDSVDDVAEPEVQLGFAEALEDGYPPAIASGDWRNWDGGKMGGKPLWLDPQHLPAPETLRCPCGRAMSFLLQVYCPLDGVDDAFHRMLYVFCCSRPACGDLEGSVVALRGQVPRDNPYHAAEMGDADSDEEPPWPAAATPAHWGTKLCVVCGAAGPLSCARCGGARYCGKAHQREHWRAGHKAACRPADAAADADADADADAADAAADADADDAGPEAAAAEAAAAAAAPSVFDEHEIVVEPEPLLGGADDAAAGASAAAAEGVVADAEDDETLNQKTMDEALGRSHVTGTDATQLAFLVRTSRAPDQVLRYARWEDGDAVLWVKEDGKGPASGPPPCGRCGAARKFEFQVMPQAVHFLGAPKASGAAERLAGAELEWGTLAVSTCTASCGGGEFSGYAVEHVHRQGVL